MTDKWSQDTRNKMDQERIQPAYALSISQSAVTGVTAREAQPANLGPAAALISRWLFLFPREVVYRPPRIVTRCEMLTFTSSGYDDTVNLHKRTRLILGRHWSRLGEDIGDKAGEVTRDLVGHEKQSTTQVLCRSKSHSNLLDAWCEPLLISR